MRACGKRYPTAGEAARSKDVLVNGHTVIDGECRCGGFHTQPPASPRSPLVRGGEMPRKPAARTAGKARDDIPEAVRKAVRERDEGCCVRCGVAVGPGSGSVHHRVRRSQGGLHVPENLILLCGSGVTSCHGHVHGCPAEARDFGWLLLGNDSPLEKPVAYAQPGGEFTMWLLKADGKRYAVAAEGVTAQ